MEGNYTKRSKGRMEGKDWRREKRLSLEMGHSVSWSEEERWISSRIFVSLTFDQHVCVYYILATSRNYWRWEKPKKMRKCWNDGDHFFYRTGMEILFSFQYFGSDRNNVVSIEEAARRLDEQTESGKEYAGYELSAISSEYMTILILYFHKDLLKQIGH